jgi:hypothetical protein
VYSASDSDDDDDDGIKVPSLQSDVSWETDVPGMVLQTVLPKYNPPPGLKYIKSTGSSGSHGMGGSAGTVGSGATMTTTDKPPPSITGKGSGSGDGDDGDEPPELDNSIFGLAKRYWYVLLPLILSNLLTGNQEEPKTEAEGGAGAAGEKSGAGAAPAGGSTASPQVRQRRGKRG